jgi:hypothetical protein
MAIALTAVACSGSTAPSGSPHPTPEIDFRGDFETGNAGQFGALECGHPEQQFRIVTEPVREGHYAARFQVAPGDNWSNGSIRCLLADYDSSEKEGDDYYYGFSMYFPEVPSDNVFWELHARRDIYDVDPNTSVSPHAIVSTGGGLAYRLLTGPAFWSGTSWTGWSHYEPNIPLMAAIPTGSWIDVVVHVRFTHSAEGLVQVWTRVGDAPWAAEPQVTREHVPTLQWIPGHDHRIWGSMNDPRVPEDVMTSSLYVEFGLYGGGDSTSTTDVVYFDDYRRGTSLSAVQAATAGTVPPR